VCGGDGGFIMYHVRKALAVVYCTEHTVRRRSRREWEREEEEEAYRQKLDI